VSKPSFRYKKLDEYLHRVEQNFPPLRMFGERSHFGSETYSLYEYRLPNYTGVNVVVDSLGCVFCQLFLYNEAGTVTHEGEPSTFWSKREAARYIESFLSSVSSKRQWAEGERLRLDPTRPEELYLETLTKGARKLYEYYESIERTAK
jgi:hypothetical protein